MKALIMIMTIVIVIITIVTVDASCDTAQSSVTINNIPCALIPLINTTTFLHGLYFQGNCSFGWSIDSDYGAARETKVVGWSRTSSYGDFCIPLDNLSMSNFKNYEFKFDRQGGGVVTSAGATTIPEFSPFGYGLAIFGAIIVIMKVRKTK